MTRLKLIALTAALAAAAQPSVADDCDCSRRLGLCQAEAVYDGAKISFTSQTDQCSRIVFSMADQSAAITIQKGSGEAAFSAPGARPQERVSVDACYVCDVHVARE